MPSRVVDSSFLLDADAASEAPGRVRILSSLAGRARHLYELATGDAPFNNEPRATQLNPDGQIGVNHSGPPWGPAFIHSVAAVSGSTSGNVVSHRGPVITAVSGSVLFGPWVVWNKNFDPLGHPERLAPYSKLNVVIRAINTAKNSANVDLTIRALGVPQGPYDRNLATAATLTIGVAEATYDYGTILSVGSAHNRVYLEFSIDAADEEIHIIGISLSNVAKLFHGV